MQGIAETIKKSLDKFRGIMYLGVVSAGELMNIQHFPPWRWIREWWHRPPTDTSFSISETRVRKNMRSYAAGFVLFLHSRTAHAIHSLLRREKEQHAGESIRRMGLLAILVGFLLPLVACEKESLTDSGGGITSSSPGAVLFISYPYHQASQMRLCSMNEDGTNVKWVLSDTTFPVSDARWSRDGTKIVLTSPVGGDFFYGDAIYVVNADGTNLSKLTYPDSGSNHTIIGLHPVWSPDSKQIAFGSIVGPEALGKYDLFITNVDGSGIKQLTFTGSVTERVWDWSLDGKKLLGDIYDRSIRDTTGRHIENTRVTFFDLEGSIVATWGEFGNVFYHPIYSRSGNRIAFVSSKGGNYQGIYTMQVGGSTDTLLVGNQYRFNVPVAWSPDDKRLLYNAGRGGDLGRVLVINIETKVVHDITPSVFDNDTTYIRAVSWQ